MGIRMNSKITLILSFLLLTSVVGCTPLSQRPQEEINNMSSEDVCSVGSMADENSLAEKIANERGTSCNAAKAMCLDAGLKPTSKEWANCYIQASGVIAQKEAARASQAAAAAAIQANIQNNMNANRPRTCYGSYGSTTCY